MKEICSWAQDWLGELGIQIHEGPPHLTNFSVLLFM